MDDAEEPGVGRREGPSGLIVYSPRYHVDIGPHVYPTIKYRLVCERLLALGLIAPDDIVEPTPATWEDLARVHTREYLDRMRDGTLSPDEIAQLELPWSEEMVDGFRLMVGGTLDAACLACGVKRGRDNYGPDGGFSGHFGPGPVENPSISGGNKYPDPFSFFVVCHLGGGLHHAFPNHGEGFCPFNDVAVAVRVLQTRGVERAAVVDLDVHHGNGTAFIFESDPRVFTCSMHQQHNYPMWKPRGSLDIGLADGTRDEAFLAKLADALPRVMASDPQVVFYLAGADPFEEDQLGGLRLTKDGLRRRDRMVIDGVAAAGVPLVIVLAGGYARKVDDTVDIHVATVEEALRSASGRTRS